MGVGTDQQHGFAVGDGEDSIVEVVKGVYLDLIGAVEVDIDKRILIEHNFVAKFRGGDHGVQILVDVEGLAVLLVNLLVVAGVDEGEHVGFLTHVAEVLAGEGDVEVVDEPVAALEDQVEDDFPVFEVVDGQFDIGRCFGDILDFFDFIAPFLVDILSDNPVVVVSVDIPHLVAELAALGVERQKIGRAETGIVLVFVEGIDALGDVLLGVTDGVLMVVEDHVGLSGVDAVVLLTVAAATY